MPECRMQGIVVQVVLNLCSKVIVPLTSHELLLVAQRTRTVWLRSCVNTHLVKTGKLHLLTSVYLNQHVLKHSAGVCF